MRALLGNFEATRELCLHVQRLKLGSLLEREVGVSPGQLHRYAPLDDEVAKNLFLVSVIRFLATSVEVLAVSLE